MEYMEYKFFLPDGSPAKTDNDVNKAIDYKNSIIREKMKSQFINDFERSLSFSYWLKEYAFFLASYKIEDDSGSFPFSDDEVRIWNTKNGIETYFRKLLSSSLKSHKELYISRDSSLTKEEVANYGRWAAVIQKRIDNIKFNWVPKHDLTSIINNYNSDKEKILSIEQEAIQKAEDEFGDWESIWLDGEREIQKYNYNVSKRNAKMNTMSTLFGLNSNYQKVAEELRKDVQKGFDELLGKK